MQRDRCMFGLIGLYILKPTDTFLRVLLRVLETNAAFLLTV